MSTYPFKLQRLSVRGMNGCALKSEPSLYSWKWFDSAGLAGDTFREENSISPYLDTEGGEGGRFEEESAD